MGKHIVSAKQRHKKDPLFPLAVALSNLHPLSKVSVDYLPHPKNTFSIQVNGEDIYKLVKEDVNYDPTKTESLGVTLKINDKIAITGSMPWIIDEVEDKIQTALGMDQLTSISVRELKC